MQGIVVYGKGKVPEEVLQMGLEIHQLDGEEALYDACHTLSGQEFMIVVLRIADEELALSAARVADPQPRVVRVVSGSWFVIPEPQVYNRFDPTD